MAFNLELSKAFIRPGGEKLLLKLCEIGHIDKVLGENPTELIEYNLVVGLLHDAGYGVLPVILKQEEEKEEEKGIDQFLQENDDNA